MKDYQAVVKGVENLSVSHRRLQFVSRRGLNVLGKVNNGGMFTVTPAGTIPECQIHDQPSHYHLVVTPLSLVICLSDTRPPQRSDKKVT